MQDDHFSYKNCYQHGSCVKKEKKTRSKKSYIRNREIIHMKEIKRLKLEFTYNY